jgi:hypothetical protein
MLKKMHDQVEKTPRGEVTGVPNYIMYPVPYQKYVFVLIIFSIPKKNDAKKKNVYIPLPVQAPCL